MRKKLNKVQRLNLIPILDAIFIFIFFLLMSAQFIDTYEIGTDAPVTKKIDPVKDKKDPLNLKVKLNKNTLVVTKGFKDKIIKKLKFPEDIIKFNETLQTIKAAHQSENSIIIKVGSKIEYQDVIKLMDYCQYPYVAGDFDRKNALFNKVIFEM